MAWYDSWFEPYTAGSIWVEARNEAGTDIYFFGRVGQMTGSPVIFQAPADEKVQLKVRGFSEDISGSFAILIRKIDTSAGVPITLAEPKSFTIAMHEAIVVNFSGEAGQAYNVKVHTNDGASIWSGLST